MGGREGVQCGLPGDKKVEVEAAKLEDGIVGTEAGVAQEEEGEQLGGELQVGSAVQDNGEDRQVGQSARDGCLGQDYAH